MRFPNIYNVTTSFNISVADIFNSGWEMINFRRALRGPLLDSWVKLQDYCKNVVLNEDEDICRWKLTKSGMFTIFFAG